MTLIPIPRTNMTLILFLARFRHLYFLVQTWSLYFLLFFCDSLRDAFGKDRTCFTYVTRDNPKQTLNIFESVMNSSPTVMVIYKSKWSILIQWIRVMLDMWQSGQVNTKQAHWLFMINLITLTKRNVRKGEEKFCGTVQHCLCVIKIWQQALFVPTVSILLEYILRIWLRIY